MKGTSGVFPENCFLFKDLFYMSRSKMPLKKIQFAVCHNDTTYNYINYMTFVK